MIIQFVPQSQLYAAIRKVIRLILGRKIIVYLKNHTERTNTQFCKNSVLFVLNLSI